MSTKNQVTIPKKIVAALSLNKGAMFDVQIIDNKIQLVPLEVVEKVFTDEEYVKLNKLVTSEKIKGTAREITKDFINRI